MKSLQIDAKERKKQQQTRVEEEEEEEEELARAVNRIVPFKLCVLNAFQIQAIMSNKSSSQ